MKEIIKLKRKRKHLAHTSDWHQFSYIQRESLAINGQKKNAAYLQSPNKCYLINGNIFYKNVSYKNMSTLHKKPSLTRCVLQTIVAFNGLIKVTGTLVYIIVNNLKY